jgi:hypothetical protein
MVFSPGLNAFYKQIMDQICNSKNTKFYKSILTIVSVVHWPIILNELVSFLDIPF